MFAVALVLVCLLQYVAWSAGNVIGIDFATDSLKIAIVKPGHPLEIGKWAFPNLSLWFLRLSRIS